MKNNVSKKDLHLDVGKILTEFQREETCSDHRKGTFKIGAPFEKALDTILKDKPKKEKA